MQPETGNHGARGFVRQLHELGQGSNPKDANDLLETKQKGKTCVVLGGIELDPTCVAKFLDGDRCAICKIIFMQQCLAGQDQSGLRAQTDDE